MLLLYLILSIYLFITGRCPVETAKHIITQIANNLVICTCVCVCNCSLLQRGSMFVFSQPQFQQLLGIGADWTAESLLDLGNMMTALSTCDRLFFCSLQSFILYFVQLLITFKHCLGMLTKKSKPIPRLPIPTPAYPYHPLPGSSGLCNPAMS